MTILITVTIIDVISIMLHSIFDNVLIGDIVPSIPGILFVLKKAWNRSFVHLHSHTSS
jgi:hypothetical protein